MPRIGTLQQRVHRAVGAAGLRVALPYVDGLIQGREALRAAHRVLHELAGTRARNAPRHTSRLTAATYLTEHLLTAAATWPYAVGAMFALYPASPLPSPREAIAVGARFIALLQRDLGNVDRYYGPDLVQPNYADLSYATHQVAVETQIRRTLTRALRKEYQLTPPPNDPLLAHYFTQLFHWMGFLDPEIGVAWPFMKELLFLGAGATMERQAIPPIIDALRARGPQHRPARILEMQCGSGCFTRQLAEALRWNHIDATIDAIDLSPVMLATARARLASYPNIRVRAGDATHLAEDDNASYDAVVSIQNLHELNLRDRQRAISEAARVIVPGGPFVVIDATQDTRTLGSFLAGFYRQLYEPYVRSFLKHPLAELAAHAGLAVAEPAVPLFLAERNVFRKSA